MELMKVTFDQTQKLALDTAAVDIHLLISDNLELLKWGRHLGLQTLATDLEHVDFKQALHAISAMSAKGPLRVLNGIGFDSGYAQDDYARIARYSQCYFDLMHELLNTNTSIELLNLSLVDSAVQGMCHAMALSVEQETTRLVARSLLVDRQALDSARFSAAVATGFAGSNKQLLFQNEALFRHCAVPLTVERGKQSVMLGQAKRFVITGGTGGVGKLLCRYLVEHHQAKVYLIGRKPLDQQLADSLKRAGASCYLSADVSDIGSLNQALAHVAKDGAIDGVFHLAGVLEDGRILNQDLAVLQRAIKPKIAGLLNLEQLSGRYRFGFVCGFSSLTALVGNMGQSVYAAGNGFMDRYCVVKQASSTYTKWYSIEWGLWQSDGMQMDTSASALKPLAASDAFLAMVHVLQNDITLSTVFAGSTEVLASYDPAARVVEKAPLPVSPNNDASVYDSVIQWLQTEVDRFCRIKNIDPNLSLIGAGVDSVGLINIAAAIEKKIKTQDPEFRLNKAILFDFSTLDALAKMLIEQNAQTLIKLWPQTTPTVATSPVVEIDPISNRQVENERESLGEVSDAQLVEAVHLWLSDIVKKHSGVNRLAVTDNLISMGIDSVASINISNDVAKHLSKVLGKVNLSKAILFEYGSVELFAGYLIEQYRQALIDLLEIKPLARVERTVEPQKTPIDEPADGSVQVSRSIKPLELQHHGYRDNDIAIVGIVGEYPGAENLDELWQLLLDGQCAVEPVPQDRWRWQDDYSADRKASNKSYGRHGGFIKRAKMFDPVFFNIAPVEAEKIDPQERRFLQNAYHALEDSGYFADPHGDVGVFAAAMFGHYQVLDDKHTSISSSFSSIANRLSYSLNLRGPSLCVDTMCSGSLTAIHLAINSLRNGECRQAIAGAVNIMSHSGKYKVLSEGNFLSPTGRCHSFGVSADGYVPAEGCVVLVLKPLAQAVADHDNIRAVIRASALNSGGRTSGYSVPSAKAQAEVINKALKQADVAPGAISYVETHGTGTSLGDPIELQGLLSSYGVDSDRVCYIGSIKSNIGHLESAAGMAGISKLVLQLANQTIVPTLSCELENPHLNLQQTPFRLAKTVMDWSAQQPRFAALSSFGAGGSNGHLIVQQYLPKATVKAPSLSQYVVVLSAKNKHGLAQQQQQLATYLKTNPQVNLYALGYTLSICREHFAERVCLVVESVEQLQQLLENQQTSNQTPELIPGQMQSSYLAGESVDFSQLYPLRQPMTLPGYPFNEQIYWSEAIEGRSREVVSADNDDQTVLVGATWQDVPSNDNLRVSEDSFSIVISGRKRELNFSESLPVHQVIYGGEYHYQGNIANVHPGSVDDWQRIFSTLAKTHQIKSFNIIHLCDEYYGEDEHSVVKRQFELAKAMFLSGFSYRVLHVSVKQTPHYLQRLNLGLGGLFRTLAMESSKVQLKQLELDSNYWSQSQWLAQNLEQELAHPFDDYSRIWRGAEGRRQMVLSEKSFLPSSERLKQQGVYLITGGMGMIGLALAERLMSQYQAKVVLLGRSALDATKEAQLEQLKSSGGEVSYISADITKLEEVKQAITQTLQQFGGLNGVIQSAGILRDCLFESKSLQDFSTVLAVKTQGTENLDIATSALSLDFFALFSSMSSLFGNVGQADYVAANGYLDQFAIDRNRLVEQGQRQGYTLAINWPLWIDDADNSEDAMAQYRSLAHFLFNDFGIRPLTLEQGSALFIRLINEANADDMQLAAFVGDGDRIRQQVIAKSQSLAKPKVTQPQVSKTQASGASKAQIAKALQGDIAGMLQLDLEQIEHHVNFGDLGFNSVLLMDLAGQIENEYEVIVPPSAFFKYNTVEKLADFLAQEGVVLSGADNDQSMVVEADGAQTPVVEHKRPVESHRFAVIGMAGQMPGGADLDDYWQLLQNNQSAIVTVQRWPDAQRRAGLTKDIDKFDAKFFGLSAREAMLMDPQHRLFLQCSYNTLLDAGYNPTQLSDVGVFAGIQFNDYQTLLQLSGQNSHPYAATGNAHAMLANRVSYLMDFTGPSQTIDTACSSALVAVNRGIMSLSKGECRYALVGGVSLLIDSAITDAAQSMGVLSPNERCATFDAEADGYVRAEGVGCVLIKGLEQALEDNDSIYAIIESSVENHGGRANSLTAPNPEAQNKLLLSAYTPELAKRVSYIETHGTGTKLGDPIEIDALKSAWQTLCTDSSGQQIHLGSVKTNIGHLEPAAGIASLLKVLLAYQHQMLPANINFKTQNPYIDLTQSPFVLLNQNLNWPVGDRVAGISSFGFGGSNAHVVLSEPPLLHSTGTADGKPHLVTLSARSIASLKGMKQAMLKMLDSEQGQRLALEDIAYTLNLGREHFEYRCGFVVHSVAELLMQLGQTEVETIEKVKPAVVAEGLPSIDDTADIKPLLEQWLTSWLQGHGLDWSQLYQHQRYHRVHLPTYHFDTKSFWFENLDHSESKNNE